MRDGILLIISTYTTPAQIVLRWTKRALVVSLDSWHEFARGEARRRGLLAKAVLRLQNASLGSAMSSWRALVSANIAARGEEARKDALLHKAVRRLGRWALARAWQRWMDCVVELKALQMQVPCGFGRAWPSRSRARALCACKSLFCWAGLMTRHVDRIATKKETQLVLASAVRSSFSRQLSPFRARSLSHSLFPPLSLARAPHKAGG